VRRAMEGIDYVFHEAARGAVPRSIKDPRGTHEANVSGTLHVFLAARDAGVKRVISASSSSVYGETPTLPKRETMLPSPKSPYAASKLIGEYYSSVFHEVYGLPTVSLRYFNVFGPRQNPNLQYAAVIPIFIRNMLAGKPCVIYGDGGQTRDFTYVSDCVKANLLACKAEGVGGEVFNIACNRSTTVNELFEKLSSLLDYRIPPIYEPARTGDVKHSYADIDKAREQLNFLPDLSVDEGLAKTVEWYRASAADRRN
jgi:nucleoside-diphosphate-sugar epimerase